MVISLLFYQNEIEVTSEMLPLPVLSNKDAETSSNLLAASAMLSS